VAMRKPKTAGYPSVHRWWQIYWPHPIILMIGAVKPRPGLRWGDSVRFESQFLEIEFLVTRRSGSMALKVIKPGFCLSSRFRPSRSSVYWLNHWRSMDEGVSLGHALLDNDPIARRMNHLRMFTLEAQANYQHAVRCRSCSNTER